MREFIFWRRGRLERKDGTSEGIWRPTIAESSFNSTHWMVCLIVAQPVGTSPSDLNHSKELDLCYKSTFHFLGAGDLKNVKVGMFEGACVLLSAIYRKSSAYRMFCLVAAQPGGTRPPDHFHSKELDLCFKKVPTFFGTRSPGNRAPAPPGGEPMLGET